MLITIHNLPSHVRYADIKALILSKCGLSEVILDNLVNEGVTKKVTVGLAEDGDAAILMRNLSGFIYEGKQLFVRDVRQKSASNKPPNDSKQSSDPNQAAFANQQMNYQMQMNQYQAYQAYQAQQAFQAQQGYPNQQGFQGQGQGMTQEAMMSMNPMMMANMMGMYQMPPQMQNSFMDYSGQMGMQSQFPGQQGQNQGKPAAIPGGNRQDNSSGFGGNRQDNSSGFGGNRQDNSSSFGGNRQDSSSRFGDNRQDSSSGFGVSRQDSSSRFGGNRQENSGGFGSYRQDNASGFGGNRQDSSSSFGGNRQDNSSGFGGNRSYDNNQRDRSPNRDSYEKTKNPRYRSRGRRGDNRRSAERSVSPRQRGNSRDRPDQRGNYYNQRDSNSRQDPQRSGSWNDNSKSRDENSSINAKLLSLSNNYPSQSQPNKPVEKPWENKQQSQITQDQFLLGFRNQVPSNSQNLSNASNAQGRNVWANQGPSNWANQNVGANSTPTRINWYNQGQRDNNTAGGNNSNYQNPADNKQGPNNWNSQNQNNKNTPGRNNWGNQGPSNVTDRSDNWTKNNQNRQFDNNSHRNNNQNKANLPNSNQNQPQNNRNRNNSGGNANQPRNNKRTAAVAFKNSPQLGRSDPPSNYVPTPTPYKWVRSEANSSNQSKPRAAKKETVPGNLADDWITQPDQWSMMGQTAELIRKDLVDRGYATERIVKQIEANKEVTIKIVGNLKNNLKRAVRTRIDILLGEHIGYSQDEMIHMYRQKFKRILDDLFCMDVAQLDNQHDSKDIPVENVPNKKAKTEVQDVQASAVPSTSEPADGAWSGLRPRPPKKAPKTPAAAIKVTVPATPPPTDKLPQYVNADKKMYKAIKQRSKAERDTDDIYRDQLVAKHPLVEAELRKEADAICEMLKEVLTPEEECEASTCKKLADNVVPKIRKLLVLNVSKRVLNINTGLSVRVHAQGKPPNRSHLHEFMRGLGVVALKKAKKGLMYVATCPSHGVYDKLCKMATAVLDDQTTLLFKAFQLTGPKLSVREKKLLVRQSRMESGILAREPEVDDEDPEAINEEELEELKEDAGEDFEDGNEGEQTLDLEEFGDKGAGDEDEALNEEDFEEW